ncbi:hypothetical protein ACTNIE_002527 [Vibrio vulnificus]
MNASTTRDIDIVELMALCENSTLQRGIQLSHSGAVHKLTMMGNCYRTGERQQRLSSESRFYG